MIEHSAAGMMAGDCNEDEENKEKYTAEVRNMSAIL